MNDVTLDGNEIYFEGFHVASLRRENAPPTKVADFIEALEDVGQVQDLTMHVEELNTEVSDQAQTINVLEEESRELNDYAREANDKAEAAKKQIEEIHDLARKMKKYLENLK